MKSLTHLSLFMVVCLGCNLITPAAPELLPPGYYIPTLAAASTIAVVRGSTPNNPVNPVNPSGQCENCNGTGKIPLRPDHPEDPSKQTCPVCGGSGKVSNDTMSRKPIGPISQPLISAELSDPETEGHPTTERPAQDQPAEADNYSEIIYVPIEQALETARKTGKPLWVHVYADGWCRECTRLANDVFPDPSVVKASREFVCSKVEWNHPWRPNLTGGTNGVPLDLFGSPDSWKSLRLSYCPKTAEAYVYQLSSKLQGLK